MINSRDFSDINAVKQFIQDYKLDFLCIFTLLFAGWKFTYGIENSFDVPICEDERIYINSLEKPNLNFSSLYSYYYLFLSYFNSSRAFVFYLNYKISFIFMPILFFLLLRRYKASILISFLVCFYMMFSNINVNVYLRVSHFALTLILIFFYIASFIKKRYKFYLFLSLAALIVSYVRPEFILTSFLVFCFAIYTMSEDKILGGGENKNHLKKDIIFILAIFLSSFLVVYLMGGIPIGGGRSWVAFSQHYALNWVSWYKSPLSPWTEADKIIKQDFGEVSGVLDCLFIKPDLFFKHVFSNIINLPIKFGNMAVIGINPFYPASFFTLKTVFNAIFLILGIIFLLIKGYSHETWKKIFNERINIVSFFYILPTFISIILVYPREHYLLTLTYVLFFNFLILRKKYASNDKSRIIIFCIIFMIFSPLINSAPIAKSNTDLIHKHMFIFLEKRKFKKEKINYLDLINIACFSQYINKELYKKEFNGINLHDFIQKESIHLIIAEENMISSKSLQNKEQWENFLESYSKAGFKKMNIPNTNRIVFLHESIL